KCDSLYDFFFFEIQFTGVGFFFFFQAEDGIRDIGVTGVQTCALPIWSPRASHSPPRSSMAPRQRTASVRLGGSIDLIASSRATSAALVLRAMPRSCTAFSAAARILGSALGTCGGMWAMPSGSGALTVCGLISFSRLFQTTRAEPGASLRP